LDARTSGLSWNTTGHGRRRWRREGQEVKENKKLVERVRELVEKLNLLKRKS
jgi:hypothetical protein